MGLAEATIADIAAVGLLSSVHAHMNGETSSAREALGAHCTHIGPLTRVPLHVLVVYCRLGEGLRTHRTPIRTLTFIHTSKVGITEKAEPIVGRRGNTSHQHCSPHGERAIPIPMLFESSIRHIKRLFI